ncbi:hypothetical protein AB5N19_01843 [Seiridium cardinale]
MADPSTTPQFVGVVGVAFLLILTLFLISLGIRRYLPRYSSRDAERGLPVGGESAPLLPEPIPGTSETGDYQQAASYGATALQPSPADRRESLIIAEIEDRQQMHESPGRSETENGQDSKNASSPSNTSETPTGPSESVDERSRPTVEGPKEGGEEQHAGEVKPELQRSSSTSSSSIIQADHNPV